MDEKDLKIEAYKQRLTEAEDNIIDLRVTLTVLRQHISELEALLKEKDEPVQEESPEDPAPTDED